MILSGLVFFTNTRKDVEYFTKTVNQTQDDGHHDRYHDYGEYQTFNNSTWSTPDIVMRLF